MLVCGNQVNEILNYPGTMWLDLNLLTEEGDAINQHLGNKNPSIPSPSPHPPYNSRIYSPSIIQSKKQRNTLMILYLLSLLLILVKSWKN